MWSRRLPQLDDDLDRDIRTEDIVFACVHFRLPVGNSTPNFVQEVEPSPFRQVSEIADEIGNSMIVACAAVPLEDRQRVCRPRAVISFAGHAALIDPASAQRVATTRLKMQTRESDSRLDSEGVGSSSIADS